MSDQLAPHKRGDTLELVVTLRDSTGALIDLTGYTITSQIRDGGNGLIHTFASPTLLTLGVCKFTAPASATTTWPLANLRTDIQYLEPGVNGRTFSTPTLVLPIVDEVTV